MDFPEPSGVTAGPITTAELNSASPARSAIPATTDMFRREAISDHIAVVSRPARVRPVGGFLPIAKDVTGVGEFGQHDEFGAALHGGSMKSMLRATFVGLSPMTGSI